MSGITEAIADWKVISPENDQCFFGYYDLNSYDSTGTIHLCNRAPFIDRIPTDQDVLELGYVKDNQFTPFAQTTAWNFQQGALLQFKGGSDDTVFYNVRKHGGYSTVMHNIVTGERTFSERAAACISPNGRYGLAINFARIFDFRPGYGYHGFEDPFKHDFRPKEDGVFLVDFVTGTTKQIISFEDIYRQFPSEVTANKKLMINHITFNESSDRFLFLLRNFPAPGEKGWGTTLITSDLEGNMHLVIENKFVSHYAWKNSNQIVAFCTPRDTMGLFLIDDITNHVTQLKHPNPGGRFGGDIHCIYSPNKRYILGDAYPDKEDGFRPLFLYDTKTGEVIKLLKSESLMDANWDIRCDLHARFNRQGTKVSFDSVHTGKRQICELDLSGLID